MISFVLALLFVGVIWWMLSLQTRKALFKPWKSTPNQSWPLIKAVMSHQLRTLSAQNTVAQAVVDFSLKTKTLRETLMFICFQKAGLALIGLVILSSLEGSVFLTALMVTSVILVVAFKKPVRILQVCALAASFFAVYQFAFYRTSQWIFGNDQSQIVFFLADARLWTALSLFALGFILTILFRFEHLSVLISSLLFLTGGLPITNAMMIILGETLAWIVYWYWSTRRSEVLKKVFSENLVLVFILAVGFMWALYTARSWGLLQIPVMGEHAIKKFFFIVIWAIWEISVSITLLVWGHFRSQSKMADESDVEVVQLPINIFKRNGWLPEQIEIRKRTIAERIQSLQAHLDSIPSSKTLEIPPALLQKSKLEVESLKSLLGALP